MKEKAARQAALRKIIGAADIETQEELGEAMADAGFRVTQATLSRDLKEMGISKVRNAAGASVYSTSGPKALAWPALKRMVDSLVSEVKQAGNIVVIKTAAGHASGVASAIDALDDSSILGSVAGDDTIIVVASDEDKGKVFAESLLRKGA